MQVRQIDRELCRYIVRQIDDVWLDTCRMGVLKQVRQIDRELDRQRDIQIQRDLDRHKDRQRVTQTHNKIDFVLARYMQNGGTYASMIDRQRVTQIFRQIDNVWLDTCRMGVHMQVRQIDRELVRYIDSQIMYGQIHAEWWYICK